MSKIFNNNSILIHTEVNVDFRDFYYLPEIIKTIADINQRHQATVLPGFVGLICTECSLLTLFILQLEYDAMLTISSTTHFYYFVFSVAPDIFLFSSY